LLDVAGLIHVTAEIAGPKPTVRRERLLVGARVVVIAEMNGGAARGDLTDFSIGESCRCEDSWKEAPYGQADSFHTSTMLRARDGSQLLAVLVDQETAESCHEDVEQDR
jgi:hypothetical protein